MPVPSATYETEHFLIIDFAQLDDPAIQVVQARLEMEFERVSQALPTFTPPAQLLARIVPGNGTPFVTPAESSLTLWGDSLTLDYLPHQLTHLFTRYVRRAFLEEGLAVYVTELLLPDLPTVHPYRGQTPHAWVSLFEDHGSTIPLLTAFGATNLGYNVNGSTFDASSWQIFVEGGSFTRWVVETHGWDAWWELFEVDDLAAALGTDPAELQSLWLAEARGRYPVPLACEEALGTVGVREEFWCARARGESVATRVTRSSPLQDAAPRVRMRE
jgi:hypothetical protein